MKVMSSTVRKNKYEIDMCNGTIMDKLISFSLPLMLYNYGAAILRAVDILDFPETQIPGGSVHLVSGVLDHNPRHADSMLFLCEEDAV